MQIQVAARIDCAILRYLSAGILGPSQLRLWLWLWLETTIASFSLVPVPPECGLGIQTRLHAALHCSLEALAGARRLLVIVKSPPIHE
jgi:hypothetical protein